jgi:hypothetical protein
MNASFWTENIQLKLYCDVRGVYVTKMTGSTSDDWIY